MSFRTVTIADTAPGPQPSGSADGPEGQHEGQTVTDRALALQDALSHIKYTGQAESKLQGALVVFIFQVLIWVPVMFSAFGLLVHPPSEYFDRWASSSAPGWQTGLFVCALLSPFILPPLLISLFFQPLQERYRRLFRSSPLVADFVHGRLDVNSIAEHVHPRARRLQKFKPARLALAELTLLTSEADWFLAGRSVFWRLSWLMPLAGKLFWGGFGWIILLGLLMSALPDIRPFMDSNDWLLYPFATLGLTPVCLGFFIMVIAYPSYLWRDLRYRAWQRPLLEAITAEVKALLPASDLRPVAPQVYEVHTFSSMLGLSRPQFTGGSPPPASAPARVEHSLADRLAVGAVSTVGGNSVLPWVLWAVPAGGFVIGALSVPSGILSSTQPVSFLWTWSTLCFVLLLLVPLGAVVADALQQLRLLRAYLPQSDVELRVALRRDLLAGKNKQERIWPASSIHGGIDEAVLVVARELGQEMKQRRRGLHLPSALICLVCALLAVGLQFIAANLDDTGELALIPALYLFPLLTLALVPASFRRRMILEESVNQIRRSLAWDGDAPAREDAG